MQLLKLGVFTETQSNDLGIVKCPKRNVSFPIINTNLYLEKSCGEFSLAFCKNQLFQV